jgi:hypothetical protein
MTEELALNDGMKALFVDPYLFLPKPYTAEQLTESVKYLFVRTRPHPPLQFPAEPPSSTQP